MNRTSGPVIGLTLPKDAHDVTAVGYVPDAAAADIRLFTFTEPPRVMPTLAHGSNAWRQFKLGVAMHRASNGASEMARYEAQCTQAACRRVFAPRDDEDDDEGSRVRTDRFEGTVRLSERQPSSRSPGDDEDLDRIDARLRSIQALRKSIDRDVEEIRHQDHPDDARTDPSEGRRSHSHFRPSAEGGGEDDRRGTSRARSSYAHPVEVLGEPRPLAVNQDDADDAAIAELLEQLGARQGLMSTAERRSFDALRTCSRVLDERSTEARIAVASTLTEAVALKRTHQAIASVCSEHPRSHLARDMRGLLQVSVEHDDDQYSDRQRSVDDGDGEYRYSS